LPALVSRKRSGQPRLCQCNQVFNPHEIEAHSSIGTGRKQARPIWAEGNAYHRRNMTAKSEQLLTSFGIPYFHCSILTSGCKECSTPLRARFGWTNTLGAEVNAHNWTSMTAKGEQLLTSFGIPYFH
jgi:hypothetical protein